MSCHRSPETPSIKMFYRLYLVSFNICCLKGVCTSFASLQYPVIVNGTDVDFALVLTALTICGDYSITNSLKLHTFRSKCENLNLKKRLEYTRMLACPSKCTEKIFFDTDP